jgi:proteasome alpha subunit
MSNTAINAYDSSSMQYHPDGRVLQIEYSKDAVKKGGPIGAYRCKDGIIVVAVRKSPMSKFLVHPMQKVFRIDSNIIIAATGLLFDASVIVDVAKRICLQHRNIYCDEMPVENLCEDLSEIMHKQAMQIYCTISMTFDSLLPILADFS